MSYELGGGDYKRQLVKVNCKRWALLGAVSKIEKKKIWEKLDDLLEKEIQEKKDLIAL